MPRKVRVKDLEHLEQAVWCALIRHRSPGDVFRFLHAIHLRSKNETCCAVCARDDFHNILPLVGDKAEIIYHSADWSLAKTRGQFENVEWLILNGLPPFPHGVERPVRSFLETLFDTVKTEFNFAENVWTILTSHIDKRIDLEGVCLQRIDRPKDCPDFPNSTACFGRTPMASLVANEPLRIAVVLRSANDWRPSPCFWFEKEFYDELEKLVPGGAAEFEFFGLSKSMYNQWPKWARIEQCHPYSGKTVPRQVEEARRFHLAIGVNSSALDVFSVAGVPVLRDCEFQGCPKSEWYFKEKYNSFLAGNLNIGLGISGDSNGETEKALKPWFDKTNFISAFEVLTGRLKEVAGKTIEWGGAPRHQHVKYKATKEDINKQIEIDLSGD